MAGSFTQNLKTVFRAEQTLNVLVIGGKTRVWVYDGLSVVHGYAQPRGLIAAHGAGKLHATHGLALFGEYEELRLGSI